MFNRTHCAWTACGCVVVLAVSGCANSAQTGAAGGAGLGAIVGQVAGRDTESTLIGAGVGAGVGYIIGNEMDKKEAQEQQRDMQQAKRTSQAYEHEDLAPLAGTRWNVISLEPQDVTPPYASKLIEFRPDGQVATTTTDKAGAVTTETERYRVVGTTLIVNRPGYLINARYNISGDELTVSCEKFSAVLKRMK